jgi:hypothetical protein
MGRLDNRLPVGMAWLVNEVLACRISPWCGSKEARTQVDLKSDMPAAVFHR